MTNLQNKKINLIPKTSKPTIFYTHVVFKREKNKNDSTIGTSSFYVAVKNIKQINEKLINDYVYKRREIPIWNGSSFRARVNHARMLEREILRFSCGCRRGEPKNLPNPLQNVV